MELHLNVKGNSGIYDAHTLRAELSDKESAIDYVADANAIHIWLQSCIPSKTYELLAKSISNDILTGS